VIKRVAVYVAAVAAGRDGDADSNVRAVCQELEAQAGSSSYKQAWEVVVKGWAAAQKEAKKAERERQAEARAAGRQQRPRSMLAAADEEEEEEEEDILDGGE
jgi:hypothetical protein